MKSYIILIALLHPSMHTMDSTIDIKSSSPALRESDDDIKNIACTCKLCKGIKVAVASNVVSIIVTAAFTMLINYSQCDI